MVFPLYRAYTRVAQVPELRKAGSAGEKLPAVEWRSKAVERRQESD